MVRRIAVFFATAVLALSTTGCTSPGPAGQSLATTPTLARPAGKTDDMSHLIYVAAQTLGDRAESLAKDKPLIVTTVVSINNLKQSSPFGRLVSELIANRLEQRGYLVRDVRYMGALEIRPETGERVLSREVEKISEKIKAQAVVAGTYAVAGKEIYLDLRVLKADNAELLSSVDVVIPLDENTRGLFDTPNENLMTLDQYETMVAGKGH